MGARPDDLGGRDFEPDPTSPEGQDMEPLPERESERAEALTLAQHVLASHYETPFMAGETAGRIARALLAESTRADRLAERLREAQDWYRDHVNDEGFYDESMWGDPFAISPQLRATLTREEAGK